VCLALLLISINSYRIAALNNSKKNPDSYGF
jgi:hypothetical protein